jgi:hypothetical protein
VYSTAGVAFLRPTDGRTVPIARIARAVASAGPMPGSGGELKIAREQGLKVVPKWPFVKFYIDKHPEFADLLK